MLAWQPSSSACTRYRQRRETPLVDKHCIVGRQTLASLLPGMADMPILHPSGPLVPASAHDHAEFLHAVPRRPKASMNQVYTANRRSGNQGRSRGRSFLSVSSFMNSRARRPLRLLLHAIALAVAADLAQAGPLRVTGTAGYLSEWELAGDVTEKEPAGAREFSGPLIWKHVGLCSVNGPQEKPGEINLRILRIGSIVSYRRHSLARWRAMQIQWRLIRSLDRHDGLRERQRRSSDAVITVIERTIVPMAWCPAGSSGSQSCGSGSGRARPGGVEPIRMM